MHLTIVEPDKIVFPGSPPYLLTPGYVIYIGTPFIYTVISNSSFRNITGRGDGGVIYISNVNSGIRAPAHISTCSFYLCATSIGCGGAVYIEAYSKTRVISCSFESCCILQPKNEVCTIRNLIKLFFIMLLFIAFSFSITEYRWDNLYRGSWRFRVAFSAVYK
jgi:hypothetical protein